MKVLEKISTKLAVKFALKLFFTPLKFNRPSRENNSFNSAKKRSLLTHEKHQFQLFEWGNSGPTILLMHGWSGRGTQFFQIVDQLIENGYHVFALDAPAHGSSSQKKTNLLEFAECIEIVNQMHGPFKAVIGHSIGGAAVMNALERELQTEKIITVGAPGSIKNITIDFCEKVKAGPKIGKAIIEYIENRFSVNSDEISPAYLAHKFKPKGLILHDTEDEDVHVKEAEILHQNWPGSKLIITSGLGHRRILMDEYVIGEIVSFINSEN